MKKPMLAMLFATVVALPVAVAQQGEVEPTLAQLRALHDVLQRYEDLDAARADG